MSFRYTITLAGLVAIVLILAGRWLREREAADQTLQVVHADLQLGDIWLQEPIEHIVNIRNTSIDEIKVFDFEANCACTAISPHSFVLKPGETRPIRVTIDLLRIAREKPKVSRWPLDISIRPTVSLGVHSSRWRLQGRILSPLRSLPAVPRERLILGKIEEPHKITIPLQLHRGFLLDHASAVTPGASCLLNETRDGSTAVEVVLDPAKMELGTFVARVDLHLRNSENNSLPPLPMEIRGEVHSSVVLEPSILLTGVRPAPAKVLLKSVVGQPFEVLELGNCEGVAVELVEEERDVQERTLHIVPTVTDESMALQPLHIDVRSSHSQIRERLTLLIQRPTRLYPPVNSSDVTQQSTIAAECLP